MSTVSGASRASRYRATYSSSWCCSEVAYLLCLNMWGVAHLNPVPNPRAQCLLCAGHIVFEVYLFPVQEGLVTQDALGNVLTYRAVDLQLLDLVRPLFHAFPPSCAGRTLSGLAGKFFSSRKVSQ